MAGSSHSNDTRFSPASVGYLKCVSHDFGYTSAVEGVIVAPLAHLHKLGFDVSSFTIAGVDAVSGSEFASCIELLGVQINANDCLGASYFCRLNDRKTNCAKSKYYDRASRLDLTGVENCAPTSRDSAAEHAHLVEVREGIHLGARDLGYDSVLCEGRASHEVANLLTIFGES